jgi:hypothetical protein
LNGRGNKEEFLKAYFGEDWKEVYSSIQKALKIFEEILPSEHPYIKTIKINLEIIKEKI